MGRHRTHHEPPARGQRLRPPATTRIRPRVKGRRRRGPAIAMIAAVVVAGVAVPTLISVSQQPSAEVPPLPSLVSAPSVPSELLAAMQRDLDLTPDQARDRMRDEFIAARSLRAVRDIAGPFYGGAWFDPSINKLVVGLTNPAKDNQALINALQSQGAEVTTVQHSLAALDATKSRFDSMSSAQVPVSIVGWYIEPRSNSVVVEINPVTRNAETEEFLNQARGDGTAIRVSWTTRTPRTLADVVGGDRFNFAVGGQLSGCSIGFSALGATSNDLYFITAGHCTRFGGAVLDLAGGQFGEVSQSRFDAAGDFGLVDVVDLNARVTPTINKFDGGSITVTGSQEIPVGASVCRSGSTTGLRCGEVIALNQTVNYGNGDIVQGLARTTACAEPGDSGGPYINGSEAQGLTSGGSGDCSVGGITYFQPINEVLDGLGVTLVTG